MIHLRSVEINAGPFAADRFPFSAPFVSDFGEMRFTSPVTFFVGENGSGKSTIMEAVAVCVNSTVVGGESVRTDRTLAPARDLAAAMKLVWNKRTRRGFFLRAEDFFRFVRSMYDLGREMQEATEELEGKFSGYGLELARGAMLGQKAAITERYGEDLAANSHGESFLKLFKARFTPGGLYLLDEPEAPLSPTRQLALLSMMKQMVAEEDAQFIVATHSPILMAFPDATIYSFDAVPPESVEYEDLEHVTITRDFLRNPERFLRRL